MEEKKFGRNQKISLLVAGIIFLTSAVLVGMGKVDGAAWLTFAGNFGPWTLGIICGGSALIKAAESFGGKPPPVQP